MATNPYSNSYYNPYGQGLFGAQYLPQITDPGPVNEMPYSLLNHVQLGAGGGGARGGGAGGYNPANAQQQGLLGALTSMGGSPLTSSLFSTAMNGNSNGPGLSSLIASLMGQGGVNAAGYGIGSWAPSAAIPAGQAGAGYASDLGDLFLA